MQIQRDIVVVVFHGTWSIVVNGDKFGPYTSEEEAVLVARTWAENAAKQGRRVNVLVDEGHTLEDSPPLTAILPAIHMAEIQADTEQRDSIDEI